MENGDNQETYAKSVEERRVDVAGFISHELNLSTRVFWEQKRAHEAITEFEARPYQQEAWERLWKAREDGRTEALLHLATGLGKTSIAVLDYAKFRSELREHDPDASPRALFVVHQNNILEQASERFAAFMPEVTQSYFSRKNRRPQTELTLASFKMLVSSGHVLPPDYFDYIIYDEAHHVAADTYERVVEYFKPKFKLGMTATPERMDNRDITEQFGESIYSKTLPEAIRENLLAAVDYRIVFDKSVAEALENGFEPHSLKELKSLFDVPLRNREIASQIRDAQQEIMSLDGIHSVKTIIFSESIEHADIIAGFVAGESYHSDLSKKEQDETLSAFRQGGLKTITVRDMFNEGVDIPDARLIVMVRSTQSKTVFEQQLGRGLRKLSDKQRVTVLDFVGNAERLAILRELVGDVFEEDVVVEGEPRQEEGGLRISMDENSFLFTQMALDIIKIYDRLHPDESIKRWKDATKEEIVKAALEISPDKPLSTSAIDRLDHIVFPKLSTVLRRFGSIYEFYTACGFSVPNWMEISNEEVIWRALAISPHAALTVEAISELDRTQFPGNAWIYRRFGSHREFQRQCGFNHSDWEDVSNEELIALAGEISPDEPLSKARIAALDRSRFPGSSIIKQRFGSMIEFQRQCGFKPSIEWTRFSNDELIDLALQLSPHKPLTIQAISQLPRTEFPGYDIILERFHSITTFHEACGFTVRPRWEEYTNQEIAQRARTLSPDKPLRQSAVWKLSRSEFPTWKYILSRFGSSANFFEACGFTVRMDAKKMSNEELITLADELMPDTAMTAKDIARLSTEERFVSQDTLTRRFGGIPAFNKSRGIMTKPIPDKSIYSKGEFIKIVNGFFPNQVVTFSQIDELHKQLGTPTSQYVLHKFGDIYGFNEARGVEVIRLREMSNDELIAQADTIAPGHAITADEITKASKLGLFISTTTVTQRFGSIKALNRLRGFEPKKRNGEYEGLNNDELVKLSLRLIPSGILTKRKIDQMSRQGLFVGSATILNKFGSYSNFNTLRRTVQE